KHVKSVMQSPVVFAVRQSKARELDLIGKEIGVNDILALINTNRLSFMMTSATQSNSGASGYLSFCYALSGNPEVLKKSHLDDPQVRQELTRFLSDINSSSDSSGWLKDLFLKGIYDAMVNYESMIIEANMHLEQQGKETLYCVYPADTIIISDSPLGYIRRGDNKREEFFLKLQEHLLSDTIQQRILNTGRRSGIGSASLTPATDIFNPEWGIDYDRSFTPISIPDDDTILYALDLYQTKLRKPTYTVFCLDYSRSMAGDSESEMKEAMTMLLDQEIAQKYLLNMGENDVAVVYAFSDRLLKEWKVTGTGPQLDSLLENIISLKPEGSTDIYTPILAGLEHMQTIDTRKYIPSIILMTDGFSTTGRTFEQVSAYYRFVDTDVPIFSIMFGGADEKQLMQLGELSRARVFDGRTDLITAFREAKGYN
ncbi:MAG: vWA domain-containing protein, partial [Spirochaetota bacterium]